MLSKPILATHSTENRFMTQAALPAARSFLNYEDEVKVEEEFWPRGGAAEFKVPGWFADVDSNLEELGNCIRDWMHEWGRRERERRAEGKRSG